VKIAMFVFNPAHRDPRVQREASYLAAAGHEVRVYAFWDAALPASEQRDGYQILRFDQRPEWRRTVDEHLLKPFKRKKKAVDMQAPPRLEPPPLRPATRPCQPPQRWLPAESSPEERKHRQYVRRINRIWARQAESWQPDVCHAHDLDTLEAAAWAARACGAALIYDSHEIWPEQQFIRSQEEADYWYALERSLIGEARAVITVNDSIVEHFRQRYQHPRVLRLYNTPRLQPIPEVTPLRVSRGKPVALFQGGYFHERGLEELIVSATLQSRVHVALRGMGAYEASLQALAQEVGAPVEFLPPAPADRLVEALAEADISLIPYPPTCMNNYLATPNKLFESLMAGVPIAGADVPELHRLLEQYPVGALFDPQSPEDIARCLVELSDAPLGQMAQSCRQLAEQQYHWEREATALGDLYRELAQGQPSRP